eukprot:Sspe_Gene.2788::Locus_923_Transcript_5_10_Confidence_0.500_Length_1174::g.2788::m.2788
MNYRVRWVGVGLQIVVGLMLVGTTVCSLFAMQGDAGTDWDGNSLDVADRDRVGWPPWLLGSWPSSTRGCDVLYDVLLRTADHQHRHHRKPADSGAAVPDPRNCVLVPFASFLVHHPHMREQPSAARVAVRVLL